MIKNILKETIIGITFVAGIAGILYLFGGILMAIDTVFFGGDWPSPAIIFTMIFGGVFVYWINGIVNERLT